MMSDTVFITWLMSVVGILSLKGKESANTLTINVILLL